MRQIDKIVLHCSASDLPGQNAAMIDKWHRQRGFQKIGYHYFICTDGKVEEGRGLEEKGAHCVEVNATSIGICLAGLTAFSDDQFTSLENLLKNLKSQFPNATVHGHNEFESAKKQGKTCPVFDITPFKDLYERAEIAPEEDKWKKYFDFLWKMLRALLKLFWRS